MYKKFFTLHFFILSFFHSFFALLIVGCSGPYVPENAQRINAKPAIYPDYTDVTLPANLCAPNFMVKDVQEVVARFSFENMAFVFGEDNKVIIDDDDWAAMRDAAKGKSITVEVYCNNGDSWKVYKPFQLYIANDTIDPYISYRLIQPSYVAYEDLVLAQRNITSFDESDIYSNRLVQTEGKGQCINCHSYQNYSTSRMLFHMRQHMGGTMLVDNGKIRKVDLKTDSTISSGVYPAWHPSLNLIAFSTNNTMQTFRMKDRGKIEVFDTASDLILYDVDNNTVSTICNDSNSLESFPTWSPDGKTLYYCDAHFEYAANDTTSKERQVIQRFGEIKYNLMRRSFNPQTHTFGKAEMVFDAAARGKSATLPRLSPDGRYLVFALGDYGCFHVWHNEADICLIDLQQPDSIHRLDGLNSSMSESYPSFSSNGRWIMTDSRREDGNYTRPYISYFPKPSAGQVPKCRKAFAVPQKNPEYNILLTKSYNRPEFMKQPVTISPKEFAAVAKTDAVKGKYK